MHIKTKQNTNEAVQTSIQSIAKLGTGMISLAVLHYLPILGGGDGILGEGGDMGSGDGERGGTAIGNGI